MRTFARAGAAAVAAIALVIGFAVPAPAIHPASVTTGTLTTFLGNFDLAPGAYGVPPCPDKPDNLQLTTTANGAWTLVGVFSRQIEFPAASGTWYQLDISSLNGSGGGWNGVAPTQPLNGVLGLRVQVFRIQLAGGPVDCTKTNLRCNIVGAFNVAGTYKTAPGNIGLPATGPLDSATLAGNSGALVVANCIVPWVFLGGTNATLTGLQVEV